MKNFSVHTIDYYVIILVLNTVLYVETQKSNYKKEKNVYLVFFLVI